MVAELGFEVDDLCLREGVIKTTPLFRGYITPPSPYMEKIKGFRKKKFQGMLYIFYILLFFSGRVVDPPPPDREHVF